MTMKVSSMAHRFAQKDWAGRGGVDDDEAVVFLDDAFGSEGRVTRFHHKPGRKTPHRVVLGAGERQAPQALAPLAFADDLEPVVLPE